MHKITLNTSIQPFFFIGKKLHLSWENPGPVEVDISTFSEQEKNWIKNAQAKKILFIEGEQKKEVKSTVSPTLPRIDMPTDRREQARKTLRASHPGISAFINKSTDIGYLKLMLEEEASSKNREKFITQLTEKIKLLSDRVGSLVGPPLTDANVLKEHNLPLVTEELEKTVTVQTGSDSD